jgi:F-type H+-transporting ATPase subunit epsilon
MPDRTFRLDVVTPDRVVLSEDVVSVVAPGVEGYLGVLPGHAPLVTELGTGALTYRPSSGREGTLAVSGGFMEVARDRTTVLADAAERAEEIDVERARRARDRARAAVHAQEERYNEAQAAEAAAALQRAENRLKLAGQGRD